jgi:diaminohydroxyphosphoribosylaminopyrimidine deaminase / 5-amino-6-(5-phosphoribosylamino)uracil reductase
MVGAVLVRDGRVVGEGHHHRFGGPHAEIIALRAAADAARGATLYVTLEPCSHHGKTPPCADALVAAGVRRAVYAAADPSTRAGGGADRLRAAGVEVLAGVEHDAARSLNLAFFRVHEGAAPFIALKLALSLDGRIAARPGARTAITGSAALREAHRLRAGHDAVMVGSGTVRVDDPLLTVRGFETSRPPVRIVADTEASLSPASRLVGTIEQAPLWLLCADDAPADRVRRLEEAGVRIVRAPRRGRRIDLGAARAILAGAGLTAILVEGGGALATELLAIRLAHRLYLFLAPVVLGDAAVPAFGPDSAARDAWRFARLDRLGADILLTLDPATSPAEDP